MWFSQNDLNWIYVEYSGFKPQEDLVYQSLKGRLKFCMGFDIATGNWKILRDSSFNFGEVISDEYDIEILCSKNYYLPRVREIGGRLEEVRKKRSIEDLSDLHISSEEGWVCLCSVLEEEDKFPQGSSAQDFFYKLLIPFFYGQSYFAKHGHFPWGEYSHGVLGIIESYFDLSKGQNNGLTKRCLEEISRYKNKQTYYTLLRKKDFIKGHWNCLCGSFKKFRDCHPKALQGLITLKSDIKKTGLKI